MSKILRASTESSAGHSALKRSDVVRLSFYTLGISPRISLAELILVMAVVGLQSTPVFHTVGHVSALLRSHSV